MIDKLAWTPLRDRAVLFARSKREPVLFYCTGGKRELGETDQQALVREVEEEAGVTLLPETIAHVHTFEGPAHGAGEGARMTMACYSADYLGALTPQNEVAELAWFTTADMHRTTPMGQEILRWFHAQGFID
jgi:8-oxo-dGTP pyrophosphatase MutT (NUDIX family)